jgi:hypothetical protein
MCWHKRYFLLILALTRTTFMLGFRVSKAGLVIKVFFYIFGRIFICLYFPVFEA